MLNEISKHENPIVYIDEIHTIVGAGSIGGGSLDTSNLLKPYLMEGKIKFIGATTFDEYKRYFEKDKALSRRFQTIEVKETSVEETIKIIQGLKSNYENYHNVKYTDEAIKLAVELSSKYINDRFLPDKAIDIIDEAGAYASMNRSDLNEVLIDEKVIEDVISRICHIPKNTVEKDEVSSLKDLEKNLENNLSVHIVKKKIPYINENGELVKPETENGYKFETLVLDMIHMMDNCLAYEVVREKEFAPIKNKTGVDSVDTAKELLKLNGVEL